MRCDLVILLDIQKGLGYEYCATEARAEELPEEAQPTRNGADLDFSRPAAVARKVDL